MNNGAADSCSPGEPNSPPLAAEPARLLVVDDEEVIRLALRELLAREGYQVVTAPNAIEALEVVQQFSLALVLTDQRMPQMTGLEFLARVKQLQPEATRVLMTGVPELGTIIDSINNGEIFRFLVKPWLREELLATVKNGVQRFELAQRNAALRRSALVMNETLAALNQSLEQQVARVAAQNRQLELLNHALDQNLHRSVELCLQSLEMFHPSLGAQARRAGELCRAMAEGLRLPADQRRVLEVSAWLHDIGLVGVPRRIIKLAQRAPDALNPAARALIEPHPVRGQELAGFVHHLADVGVVIRSHHERFDGGGYPDRLAGESIPFLARLLAVAAAFAESPRKEAETLEHLQGGSGTWFDPEAVRIFLRHRPPAIAPRRQREVLVSELQPGMVLARNVCAADGLVLLPEGQQLDAARIEKLRWQTPANSIRRSLWVYD